jgi:hypothetical protein
MTVRRVVVQVASAVAAIALVTACGSGDDGPSSTSDSDDTVAAASAPGPATAATAAPGAVEIIAGAPGAARTAGCAGTRAALELAVETYVALTGAPPAAQSDLVDDGFVTESSPWFEVSPEGGIVPSPGSPCL